MNKSMNHKTEIQELYILKKKTWEKPLMLFMSDHWKLIVVTC